MANNLTLQNSAAFETTTPKFGTAALWQGYVSCPSGLLTASGVWTVEAWFKMPHPAGLQVVAGQNGCFYLGITTSGFLNFQFGGPSGAPVINYTGTTDYADSAWHHIELSVGSGGQVAVDGVVVTSFTGAQQTSANNVYTVAGSPTSGTGTGWLSFKSHGGTGSSSQIVTGEVDECVVWNVRRHTGNFTPPAAPYTGSETGLVGLYHLDSNGNDSTVTAGYTLTGPASGTVGLASSNFTITVTNASSVTFTPSDGGAGGTFSPTTVPIAAGTGATGTFTYTPSSAGLKTITTTNNASLVDPSGVAFTASAGSSPTISAPTVTGLVVGGSTTISGTFTNGAPTGLSQVLDGTTTTVSSPNITTNSGSGATAAGTYSYAITTPAAGAHTIQVNGTGAFAATGSGSTGFTTSGGSIAATNAAIVYSPYTWFGGKTNNPGAYARTVFSGSSVVLNFDMTGLGAPYPQIWVSIDGVAWQRFVLAATITPTMPTTTTGYAKHTLEMVVKSVADGANLNKWTVPLASAVVLTSLTLATGGTVSQPSKSTRNILCFGDSITTGNYVSSEDADTGGSDARNGWAFISARHLLGAEVGVVGMSAQGVTKGGQGGVPAVGSAYNLIWAGQVRIFTPNPDLIVINEGTNDGGASSGTFQSALTPFLNALLGATTFCPIACLRPFNGTHSADIQAVIAAIGSPRLRYIDTTGMFDTSLSADGTHPYGVANIGAIAPQLANKLRPLLTGIPNGWVHS